MMYAIFKDDKQVTKAHSTREAAMVEAFEAKLAYYASPDFPGDKGGFGLYDGYKLKEVEYVD